MPAYFKTHNYNTRKSHDYNTRGIRFNYSNMEYNPIPDKYKNDSSIDITKLSELIETLRLKDPLYLPTEEELWLEKFDQENDDTLFEQNVDLDFNENEESELDDHDVDDDDMEQYDDDEDYIDEPEDEDDDEDF
jgi:hypothetical protein